MTLPELVALLGMNLALMVVAMLFLWGLALRLRDVGFIDGVWPLGMAALALVAFVSTDGDGTRKFLLLWLSAIWAARLGWHLLKRWREGGVQGRYAGIFEAQERERGWGFARTALLCVFLPQGVLAWLTALPVQMGQAEPGPVGWIGWAGAILAVFGIGFENIADAQLSAFRKAPANRGRVLDTGLWRYTRHPNYFGDACVWWGLWLIAAETGWTGVISGVGPAVLTAVLAFWSLREPRLKYADYARRTSGFIPMPPRDRS